MKVKKIINYQGCAIHEMENGMFFFYLLSINDQDVIEYGPYKTIGAAECRIDDIREQDETEHNYYWDEEAA